MSRPLRIAALLASLLAAAASAACAPTVTGADFHELEKSLVERGFFRMERDPVDAPFTNAMLVENFDRIAFGREPGDNPGRERLDFVERWEEPLRWWIKVDGPEAAGALRDVERTFARLARATGLDIARVEDDRSSNVDILFLGPQDYPAARAWARRLLGDEDVALIEDFRTDADTLCRVRTYTRAEPEGYMPAGSFGYALVLIRKGYSDAYRLSCVEEELAQMLGVGNDDPRVRPSAFNDDEEFALLTTHDEYLLRMLYHPRLRAGMSRTEAMPLVRGIVEELRPGG